MDIATKVDTGPFEILDFEDELISVSDAAPQNSDHTPRSKIIEDEGELDSEEESDSVGEEGSSEEGEVQSEIEEMEVATETPLPKKETPWERGLRLAHEKLEKVKALKASEKDIAEKRMTLAVSAPEIDERKERSSKKDIFWLCYFQPSIVGRTELTGHRFLLDDLRPPCATELAHWRLGLSSDHRGRSHKQRPYRRGSSASSSPSHSSSSRASSVDTASVASSLNSVAESWKVTCARAMKDYLSSPIRNKDRRRRSSSGSSGSYSESGSSNSGSDSEESHAGRYRDGHKRERNKPTAASKNAHWRSAKRSESGGSSRSRSSSVPSERRRHEHWKQDHERTNEEDAVWDDSLEPTDSINIRSRADIPPLPHERPVKRPWVAAPGLNAPITQTTDRGPREPSSDKSRSPSPMTEERRFITSWSRSPSPEDNRVRHRRPALRRERLPDVVPGPPVPSRLRHPITPSVRSHLPGNSLLTMPTDSPATFDDFAGYPLRPPEPLLPSRSESVTLSASVQQPPQPTPESVPAVSAQGQLPPNRPEVRMTLAPRLKASTVDLTNIPGGVSRPVGRTNQPSPPRLPRIPFSLVPAVTRALSPPNPGGIDQSEIRRQAEAAAAIVEARERRRAALEAAKRKNIPKKKKRDDLSKIPVRGRPTYRRQSFSDSSDSDSRSRSNTAGSRSPSGTPEPNIIMEADYVLPKPSKHHHHHRRKNINVSPTYEAGDVGYAKMEGDPNFNQRGQFFKEGMPKRRKDYQQPTPVTDYPYRSVQQYPKQQAREYGFEDSAGYHQPMPRIREGRAEYATRYPDSFELQPQRRLDSRRAPNEGIQHSRPHRPRTPHADLSFGDAFGVRSPRGYKMMMTTDRKRAAPVDYLEPSSQPSRKRYVAEDPDVQPSQDSWRTAKSRHRSRGPGGNIDRSEPFESADSSAAEQRLRELRERLNVVDDAIAELKAGSNRQGYGDARR